VKNKMIFRKEVRYRSGTFTVPRPEKGFPIPEDPKLNDEYVLMVVRITPRDFPQTEGKRITKAQLDKIKALGYPVFRYNGSEAKDDMPDWSGGGSCIDWHGGRWNIF
jgi:hypothetical protein